MATTFQTVALDMGWRYVPQGRGGTYRFRDLTEQTLGNTPLDLDLLGRIGTRGCRTTVGVYFKLDDHSCFVAHIDAFALEDDREIRTKTIRDDVGERLRDQVLSRLREHAAYQSWQPTNPNILPSLILVCPVLELDASGETVKLAPAHWVLDAINQFLNVPAERPCDILEWFVVNHRNGAVESLTYDEQRILNGEEPPVLMNSVEMTATTGESWTFDMTPRLSNGHTQH